jgi:hypothetical protein
MPKLNPKVEAIREARFIRALAENASAKAAYKAVNPHVTDNSARVMGSRELAKIDHEDINALYKRIGCTKDVVIAGVWDRMKKTRKDSDYLKGSVFLGKVGGWDANKSPFADLLARDMDLVEIIKVRLRKRSDKKDLDNIIDVDNSSTNET